MAACCLTNEETVFIPRDNVRNENTEEYRLKPKKLDDNIVLETT